MCDFVCALCRSKRLATTPRSRTGRVLRRRGLLVSPIIDSYRIIDSIYCGRVLPETFVEAEPVLTCRSSEHTSTRLLCNNSIFISFHSSLRTFTPTIFVFILYIYIVLLYHTIPVIDQR